MVGKKFDKDPIFEYPVDDRLVKRLKVSPTISAKALRNAIRSHFSLELPDSLDLQALIDRYVLLLHGEEIPESRKDHSSNVKSIPSSSAYQPKQESFRTSDKAEMDVRPSKEQSTSEFRSVITPRVPLSETQPKASKRKSDMHLATSRPKEEARRLDDTNIVYRETKLLKTLDLTKINGKEAMQSKAAIQCKAPTMPVPTPSPTSNSANTELRPPEPALSQTKISDKPSRHLFSGMSRSVWVAVLGAIAAAVLASCCHIEVHTHLPAIAPDNDAFSVPSSALVSAAPPPLDDAVVYEVKLAPSAEAAAAVLMPPSALPPVPPGVGSTPASSALATPMRKQRKSLLALLAATGAQLTYAIAGILAKAIALAAASAAEAAEPLLRRLQDPRAWSYVLCLSGGGGPQPLALPAAAA